MKTILLSALPLASTNLTAGAFIEHQLEEKTTVIQNTFVIEIDLAEDFEASLKGKNGPSSHNLNLCKT